MLEGSPSHRDSTTNMPAVITRLTTNASRLERMVTKKRNQLSAKKMPAASVHAGVEVTATGAVGAGAAAALNQ